MRQAGQGRVRFPLVPRVVGGGAALIQLAPALVAPPQACQPLVPPALAIRDLELFCDLRAHGFVRPTAADGRPWHRRGAPQLFEFRELLFWHFTLSVRTTPVRILLQTRQPGAFVLLYPPADRAPLTEGRRSRGRGTPAAPASTRDNVALRVPLPSCFCNGARLLDNQRCSTSACPSLRRCLYDPQLTIDLFQPVFWCGVSIDHIEQLADGKL